MAIIFRGNSGLRLKQSFLAYSKEGKKVKASKIKDVTYKQGHLSISQDNLLKQTCSTRVMLPLAGSSMLKMLLLKTWWNASMMFNLKEGYVPALPNADRDPALAACPVLMVLVFWPDVFSQRPGGGFTHGGGVGQRGQHGIHPLAALGPCLWASGTWSRSRWQRRGSIFKRASEQKQGHPQKVGPSPHPREEDSWRDLGKVKDTAVPLSPLPPSY